MTQNQAALAVDPGDLDRSLRAGKLSLADLSRTLDAQDPEARLALVRSLSKKAQAQLFEAAKGVRALSLTDLVPKSVPPLTEVVHEGKNSLPMFSHFAKVFARTQADANELVGYNRSGGFLETFVGPGYYVAYESNGEVLVDYTRLPASKLEHWPAILSNRARASRFVYAGMVDVLRAVSRHVSIGRALRNGQEADNWFVLCRTGVEG